MPAAVKAPYERGETAAHRQVKSQAERDLEVLALEDRKGPMLDQLDALAADDRLDTASVRKIGWFRGQVDSARSGARLDELVALFPQTGIRRRRWWHGEPAAELDSAGDDDGQADDDHGSASRQAPAAPAAAVDYAAGLAARNWILKPHGAGVCHVVELTPHGWEDVSPDPCARHASHIIPGGAICEAHDRAVTTARTRRSV